MSQPISRRFNLPGHQWGSPTASPRRLLFLSDLPRLPEPMPRALAPDTDRALMGAIAALDDHFARCGLTMLRAAEMRAGELLDLELDWATGNPELCTHIPADVGTRGRHSAVLRALG